MKKLIKAKLRQYHNRRLLKLLNRNKIASFLVMALAVSLLASVGMTYQKNSQAAVETAKPADSLIDTMGFATHIRYWNQDVFDNTFKPLLCQSGVRHVRDGGSRNDARFTGNLAALYRDCGIKSTLVMDPRDGNNGGDGAELIQKVGVDAVAVLEGPNEWDLDKSRTYAGKTWPENMRIYMNELWNGVKNHSDPKIRAVKIATPTIAMQQVSGAEIGQLQCDLGAIHPYPGSPNKPDDKLDSVWIPRHAQEMCAGKQWISTESGYCNVNAASGCSGQGGVSRRTTAKYVLRHYMEYFIRGVYIDHWYNFSLDNWSGILENDGAPKPAFHAVKNFTTLLKDPGAPFQTGSLEYSITGGPAELKKQLLQKRDGKFYLITWLNVLSTPGGHNNHTDLDTTKPITINFGTRMASVRAYYPTFDGTTVKENYTNVMSINTNARDQVVIYELTPEGTVAPPVTPGPGTNLPDLVVTSISHVPGSLAAGQPTTFSAVIKNQGTGSSPSGVVHGVSFKVNGTAVAWSDTHTASIAPGSSVTLTANGGPSGSKDWIAIKGTHTSEAHVDDIDRIPNESDETNNTMTKSITVTETLQNGNGDANNDGRVNAIDLSIVISKDGQNYPAADFNNDGTVGAADMAILLGKWTW